MKALVRHNQPRSANLFSDMDRLLNTFFDDMPAPRVAGPRVDVREEEDRYLLEAELPGFTENEVDVKVEDNLLTISSRREEEKKEEKKEEKSGTYLVRERRSSSFSRSFVLPRDVDSKKINGSFADGVLTLTLEKSPEAKPREIKIRNAR